MIHWPQPTNPAELRAFLGLIGYYRKFVKGYGLIAKPLTNLLRLKSFHWSTQAQEAFDTLKLAMTQTLVLALPDFQKPFTVETDAYGDGIGAVLMQAGQPIAYLSKALGDKHKSLSIYEKEFLAWLWRNGDITSKDKSLSYILTDHKSLSYLTKQNLHSEMQRKAMTKLMGL